MAIFPVNDLITEVEEIGETGKNLFEQALFSRLSGKDEIFEKIKDGADPRTIFTQVDDMSHKALGRFFEDLPGTTVIAEEGRFQVPGRDFEDYTAVIDDWDGSYNGQMGCSLSAISIAIDLQNRPFLGIWHDPYRQITLITIASEPLKGMDFIIHKTKRVIFRKKISEDEIINRDLDFSHAIIPFSSPPMGATELSKARIVIGRGTYLHKSEELVSGPLGRLRASVREDLNYGSSVYALMSVAMGMVDGFVIAGNKVWDLWGARIFFNALRIPHVFIEPWTYRILEDHEVILSPEKEYAFACANNEELFAQVMAKIIPTY